MMTVIKLFEGTVICSGFSIGARQITVNSKECNKLFFVEKRELSKRKLLRQT